MWLPSPCTCPYLLQATLYGGKLLLPRKAGVGPDLTDGLPDVAGRKLAQDESHDRAGMSKGPKRGRT